LEVATAKNQETMGQLQSLELQVERLLRESLAQLQQSKLAVPTPAAPSPAALRFSEKEQRQEYDAQGVLKTAAIGTYVLETGQTSSSTPLRLKQDQCSIRIVAPNSGRQVPVTIQSLRLSFHSRQPNPDAVPVPLNPWNLHCWKRGRTKKIPHFSVELAISPRFRVARVARSRPIYFPSICGYSAT